MMRQAEAAGLFDALEGDVRHKPPTVEELRGLFDDDVVIGVWRRTPYTLGEFPTCLVGVALGEACAVGWHGLAVRLECREPGCRSHALRSDLSLGDGTGATWIIESSSPAPTHPFRGDVRDFPVKIRHARDGRLLCSRPKDGRLALVRPDDCDLRDTASHNFVYNVAWECSPLGAYDNDHASLAFLNDYLDDDRREAEL
ncbi:hypothetical protein CTAYLR_003917 [Chrysophaeum taylorii]|uniref:Uncharacterized protein n=1 Tax=Chrysophaeum taylorii TaxID=2483200 RepID=A0AAD7U9W6_9STRA|nr:hypothetical protein CTAYLR_003917 [Chrysophaeum taylorii]